MTETEAGAHVQAIKLRRLSAGELGGAEATDVEAHTSACPTCRARLKEIVDEQRRFEQEISFDRFAAGVERAARAPRALPAGDAAAVRRWLYPTLAMAAAVALMITFVPRAHDGVVGAGAGGGLNRTKGGGAGITVQIGGSAKRSQRTAADDAAAAEALAPGERLRIGYRPGAHDFVTAVSIDDKGQVSPIYPESGSSLRVPRLKGGTSETTIYLPDSIELTGKGPERLIVILGDKPIDVEAVKQAAGRAFQQAKGDIAHLPSLDVPGEQFQRTFVKP